MAVATPSFDTIFCAAIEMPSPEDRAAYIADACRDDADLRGRIEKLVWAHFQAGAFLEPPAESPDATATYNPASERPGTMIGPYKLLQQIGEGGMGTVYMAEQTEPVKRKVALKIIKAGMDSRQVIARFEAERQALAMMDHVNIARVFDGGTTGEPDARARDAASLARASGSGRPYFVMELVHGVPITKYCDDNHLTPRQRLELFVPVCQAIQHAHQKGIVHRDIKPSNVMVTLYDGKPVPKVIDFGVAKATEQKLTERTLFTQYGTMVGTLEYMSPEQAEMSALGVDTRSDIYSLGVLLYELLTGSTPISHKRLKEAAFAEILRMIKEEEPPKPSTRLSDSGEALASISANRHMEPAKLTKLVRGELDWIVMKTLEKDRNRRYETANGFAADVLRYLSDEPVLACPPSAMYRLKKFVRRNKGPVLAASLVLLVLTAGIIGTAWQAVRTGQARQAEAERAEGERLAKETAEKRLAQIERGMDLLSGIFINLDPQTQMNEDRPLRAHLGDRLVQTAAAQQEEAVSDPLVVARMQNRLGLSLMGLGYPDRAIPLFTRILETRSSLLGPDHTETLTSMNNLALAYMEDRQLDKALPLFEESLRVHKAVLGPDDARTLNCMNGLAVTYRKVGRLPESISLHKEVLNLGQTTLTADDPATLTSMNNLALSYLEAQDLDRALELLEETLKLTGVRRGPTHYDTLRTMNNLALAYAGAGRPDDARPLFERTRVLIEDSLGREHPLTLLCIHNLAGCYQADGRPEKALPLFQQAAEGVERRQFRHEYAGKIVPSLFNAQELGQQFAQAEVWRRKWVAVVKEQSGADSLPYGNELAGLGLNLVRQKKWTESEPVLRGALAIREAKVPDSWRPFNTSSMLGGTLVVQQKYDEAEPLLIRGYEGLRRHEAKIPPQFRDQNLREALERLVQLYDASNKPAEAAKWRKELEARPKK